MKQINKIMYITNNKVKLVLELLRSKQGLVLYFNSTSIVDFYSTIEDRFYIYYHTSNTNFKTFICSFNKKNTLKEYGAVFHSIRNLINETNK